MTSNPSSANFKVQLAVYCTLIIFQIGIVGDHLTKRKKKKKKERKTEGKFKHQ